MYLNILNTKKRPICNRMSHIYCFAHCLCLFVFVLRLHCSSMVRATILKKDLIRSDRDAVNESRRAILVVEERDGEIIGDQTDCAI